MSQFIMIHNPKCSKSRKTLELLEEKGLKPKLVRYLEGELTRELLVEAISKLKLPLGDLLRQKEEEFKSLSLDLEDREAVVEAVLKCPKILERPIIICGDRAVIGRPPENVLEII